MTLSFLIKHDILEETDSIKSLLKLKNELIVEAEHFLRQHRKIFRISKHITLESKNFTASINSTSNGLRYNLTDSTGNDITGHSNNFIVHHNLALDELIPLSIFKILLSSSSNHNSEIIAELKKNYLAHKVLNVYYRIKRNVEYIARGKQSLYSITPNYPNTSNFFINSRNSRHYFNLIAHHPNQSFGKVLNLAAHIVQNNKISLEQNTKGLQGYKLL